MASKVLKTYMQFHLDKCYYRMLYKLARYDLALRSGLYRHLQQVSMTPFVFVSVILDILGDFASSVRANLRDNTVSGLAAAGAGSYLASLYGIYADLRIQICN